MYRNKKENNVMSYDNYTYSCDVSNGDSVALSLLLYCTTPGHLRRLLPGRMHQHFVLSLTVDQAKQCRDAGYQVEKQDEDVLGHCDRTPYYIVVASSAVGDETERLRENGVEVGRPVAQGMGKMALPMSLTANEAIQFTGLRRGYPVQSED